MGVNTGVWIKQIKAVCVIYASYGEQLANTLCHVYCGGHTAQLVEIVCFVVADYAQAQLSTG